jgi:hypothetical protein
VASKLLRTNEQLAAAGLYPEHILKPEHRGSHDSYYDRLERESIDTPCEICTRIWVIRPDGEREYNLCNRKCR